MARKVTLMARKRDKRGKDAKKEKEEQVFCSRNAGIPSVVVRGGKTWKQRNWLY